MILDSLSLSQFHLQNGETLSIVHYQFYNEKGELLADLPLAVAS